MSKEVPDVDSIFCAAIELGSADERAAYLDHACSGDVQLRRRLETLLDAHNRAGSFLESPATALGATIALSISEQPGAVIGPYKLLEQIGEGGMGVVYMADQQSPVRRRVALKIIKPGMDTQQVIARFEAERQALALMDHTNIARVLDAGATDSGRPYFVMELVRGIPITEYCDKNNLPVRERLELFVQVCHALQHAHQKGIIHRDIKPSNVMVTLVDGRPAPKIIDFGIAKATNQQLTDKTLFTNFAQMIGTPLYMSPEQSEMTSLDVDTRSDIYSMGVLLYELLTGTTPFDQRRLREAALDEIRRIIREEDPPQPSTRISTLGDQRTVTASHRKVDPNRLSQLLRGDLDWIVMKSIEKNRTHRYETANALARDIQRYLANEPVEACPHSAFYRFRKFARRNRMTFITGILVSAALLLGTVVSTWQAVRAKRAEGLAETRLETETKARSDAEAARTAEATQRLLAEELESQAKRQLFDAELAHAKAASLSRRIGQRFDSLEAVRKATKLARELNLPEERFLEIRNAAVASLALPDLRLAKQWEGWPERSRSVDFDGALERYVRADDQGAVSIRRVADDAEIASLPGFGSQSWPTLSRDGKLLGVSSPDGLKIWNIGSSEPTLVLRLPNGVRDYDSSPDGRKFAVIHADNSIGAYEASGESLRQLLPGLPASRIEYRPGGRQVAVSCGAVVEVRDLETGTVVAVLQHPGPVGKLAWHPDGKTLAVVYTDKILLWDVDSQKQRFVLEGLRHGDNEIAFDHAGDLLASTGWGEKLRLWDSRTGQQLISTMSGMCTPRFSTDDHLLACKIETGKLGLWEIASGSEYRTLVRNSTGGKGFYGGAPAIHLGGRLLAVAMGDGVGFWDLASGQELGFLESPGPNVVLFEPSGALLTNSSIGLRRWPVQFDPATPQMVRLGPPTRLSAPGSPCQIACSHDGKVIASAQFAGALVLHSDSPDHPLQLGPHDDVRCVSVSPDGQWVATGSHLRRLVKIWESKTGKLVKELPLDGSAVGFSPNGKWLRTSAGGVRLWAVGSWEEGPSIDGPGPAAFSPDSKMLALDTGSGAVRLVDPDTGREYAQLNDPNQDAGDLSFSPDGTQLVTTNDNTRSIHVWNLRKIRGELTRIGLDWDTPAYPPANQDDQKSLHLQIDLGEQPAQ